MGHHTILVGPRYKAHIRDIFVRGNLAKDMSLYVHRPSVTDLSVAPLGDDTFHALSPVPNLGIGETDWKAEAEGYRQKMLEEQLLPGLGDHLSKQLVFTPNSFKTRYLSPYGLGFSIEPRILQLAWFRPHTVSKAVKGLYRVGAATHPGRGCRG